MSYYLEDHPNPNTPQFGWERAKLGQPGVHLSGVIGVHTSEAITDFEGVDNNAENNAAFIGRRTDYGSYHTTGDADSILPLVHPRYAAWADTTNNPHAMSVSGCLQAARWLEMTPERRRAVVVNMGVAAARMVLTAVADGYLAEVVPARRITAAEAISGSRPGFYGHGETNPGTRYDPGAHFDWNLFLAAYAEAVGITPQEDSLSAADVKAITDAINLAFQRTHDELPGLTAKAVVDQPVPHKDPITGQDTGQTTSLATMAGFTDFQHTNTRESLLAAVRGIVDAVKAAPGPDAALVAEEAYAAFAEKLAGIKLTVTAGGE